MANGYEIRMYHDIHSIAESLEKIAKSLEKLTGLTDEVRYLRQDTVAAVNEIPECVHE